MTLTGNTTSGSKVITDISSTGDLYVGMTVSGSGIPASSTITSVDSATQVTILNNATITATGVSLVFSPTFQAAKSAIVSTTSTLTIYSNLLISAKAVRVSASASLTISKASLAVNAICRATGVAQIVCDKDLKVSSGAKASVGCTLTLSAVDLSAVGRSKATGEADLYQAKFLLQAEGKVSALSSVSISVLHDLAAGAITKASVNSSLTAELTLVSSGEIGVFASAIITMVGQGVTVPDVVDDIMMLWGIEDVRMSVEPLRERAISDLNASMQTIWAIAKDRDYFSRKTLQVQFLASETSKVLGQDVQSVLAPIRLQDSKRNLRALSSRSQLDLFGHIFLGRVGVSVPTGEPSAYFIERLNQGSADNTKVTLHVVPAPTADTTLLVDVAIECPRYEWKDYCRREVLQIPHRYAESILLPICRHRAMSSQYFVKEDRAKSIEADFSAAMQMLGVFDPSVKETEASKGVKA